MCLIVLFSLTNMVDQSIRPNDHASSTYLLRRVVKNQTNLDFSLSYL
jgi:hypothetical protein